MSKYITILKNEFSNTTLAILVALGILYFTSIRVYDLNFMSNLLEAAFLNTQAMSIDLNLLQFDFGELNVIWIALLVFLQYRFNDNKLWRSLPYTKTQLFVTKFIYGIITITVIFALYSLGIIMVYQKYSPFIYDIIASSTLTNFNITTGTILSYVLVPYLFCISLYTVMTAMRYTIKHSVIGIVVGTGVYIIPTVVASIIEIFVNKNLPSFDFYTVYEYMYFLFTSNLAPDIPSAFNALGDSIAFMPFVYGYAHLYFKIITLIIVTIAFTILAFVFARSNKQELEESVFVFSGVKVLVIAMAVLVSMHIVCNIFYYNEISNLALIILNIVAGVFTAVVSILVINKFDKQIFSKKRSVKNEN